MGAFNGFNTAAPDSRYGDANGSSPAGSPVAQRFVCTGSGTLNILSVGAYLADGGTDQNAVFAIYADDAVNGCPGDLIANSTTANVANTSGLYTLVSYTYSTQPQITSDGTTVFWIAYMGSVTNSFLSRFDTGGTAVYLSEGTYPTFPSNDEWHAAKDLTRDYSLYAVYEVATPTGQFARPSSDVADGNWLNEADSGTNLYASIDEVKASDVDYIKSGASPANDTCTVGLGALSTPVSGTTTMRIRAKFL